MPGGKPAKPHRRARATDAGEKGREAISAVREVGGNVVDAVDKSLKQRPYTALALAVGLGFLFGAIWRR
jgi:ElaB/YqjD/DUF883 family membrane-anchored ribosome-binding protein